MKKYIIPLFLIVLTIGFFLSCSGSSSSSDSSLSLTAIRYNDSGTDGDWFTPDDVAILSNDMVYYSRNLVLSIVNMEKRALRDSINSAIGSAIGADPWLWNWKTNIHSDNNGTDDQWLTEDDTYIYVSDSEKESNLVNKLVYDESVYPAAMDIIDRQVFTLSGNNVTKLLDYNGSGTDGIWNTDDDDASGGSTLLYFWNSNNRIERIRRYSGDEAVFELAAVITYDTSGRLDAITKYSDIDETVIDGGFDFEYSADGNTIERLTKDATWASTGRATYQYISAAEIRITQYLGSGIDGLWNTPDDVVSGYMSRTFLNGLPDKLINYKSDGTTVNEYFDYIY